MTVILQFSPVPAYFCCGWVKSPICTHGLTNKVSTSRLANGGEICVWRLVPPVGHCNSLYLGSGKRQHWGSSQEDPDTLESSKYKYYVLHLSKELFHKTVSALKVVQTDCFSLMCLKFNVWKKVGNYCFMQDNTVLQLFPTFFQTLKLGYIREKQSVLTISSSLTFLGNGCFER